MEQYVIEGQTKLRGMLPVHGAKNAALPILAGTLLGVDWPIAYLICVIGNLLPIPFMWRRPLPFCSLWAAGCSRSRV